MLAFSFNNDPTFVGWLTFAGYVIAALICAHRAMHPIAPPHADARNLRRFWFILTATLILLGFNKQADLQTTLIHFAKTLSETEGWYEHRRIVQWCFTILVAGAAIGYILFLVYLLRHTRRSNFLVLIGLACLLAYICLRVADVDRVTENPELPSDPQPSHIWPLELLGISVIAISALIRSDQSRSMRKSA